MLLLILRLVYNCGLSCGGLIKYRFIVLFFVGAAGEDAGRVFLPYDISDAELREIAGVQEQAGSESGRTELPGLRSPEASNNNFILKTESHEPEVLPEAAGYDDDDDDEVVDEVDVYEEIVPAGLLTPPISPLSAPASPIGLPALPPPPPSSPASQELQQSDPESEDGASFEIPAAQEQNENRQRKSESKDKIRGERNPSSSRRARRERRRIKYASERFHDRVDLLLGLMKESYFVLRKRRIQKDDRLKGQTFLKAGREVLFEIVNDAYELVK
ncbi:uncharacterized protein LOC129366648 [Poeciliopsis prolifica]|uniref:uncharacterized protein LOC129366648 n=1 Tax=Poeciliopsis prolifica TaxID=188132 RepID=UPI00241315F1|nr:uncharacterized protein LOC129366648 [Poeciliopsis prolifica]